MAPPFDHTQSIITESDDVTATIASVTDASYTPSSGVEETTAISGHSHNVRNISEDWTNGFETGTGASFNVTLAAVSQAVSNEFLTRRPSDRLAGDIGGGGGIGGTGIGGTGIGGAGGGGLVSVDSIMDQDYSDVKGNLTSDLWHRYTCMSSFQVPDDFFKNVLEPIICGSGIVGIILTMIVLSRKTMVTSTNCYLTALAVGDLFYLLMLLSRIILDKIDDCNFQISTEKSIYSHFVSIFMDASCYATIGVTVMLAVERYIAICQPMQAMTLCSVKRARIIIVIIAIVAFFVITPRFTEMDIESIMVKPHNETVLTITFVSRYNEQVYVYIVQGFLVTLLPVCCLLGFNVLLIIEIRRSTRYLQVCLGAADRSVVTQEELKITIMLISVVVVFFVCQAPYMVWSLMVSMLKYRVLDHTEIFVDIFGHVFKRVVQCMLALKSSCNFILYCWFSEKFWITFKRLFCLSHCLPSQGIHRTNGCSNNNSNNNHHRPSCYITRETTC